MFCANPENVTITSSAKIFIGDFIGFDESN